MQPTFNSWIGYYDMIDQSDIFILYDDVQLSKQSWQVRNVIKNNNGKHILSIPYIKDKTFSDILLTNAEINNNISWKSNHLKTIEFTYKKSNYYKPVYNFISDLYNKNIFNIADFNICIIESINSMLGIDTKLIRSSNLNLIGINKTDRILNICKNFQATEYLSPIGATDYMNENNALQDFKNHNIQVHFHNYNHPVYKQLYGNFIPYIGIFDLLFNEGFDNSLKIIKSGRN